MKSEGETSRLVLGLEFKLERIITINTTAPMTSKAFEILLILF